MSNTPNVKLQVAGDACAEGGAAAVVDTHKGLLQNTLAHDFAIDEAEARKIAAKEFFAYKTAVAQIEAMERMRIRNTPTILDKVQDFAILLLPFALVGGCFYMAYRETSAYEKNKQP